MKPGTAANTWFASAVVLVAIFLRVWLLEMKPAHFDEGINGHFVAQMWKDGYYRYDPTNFHGPLFFYFLQLSELLFGRTLAAFRLVPVAFSVATCWLIIMHRRFFGSAALWAAVIFALSPASVFYARYAIHESLFIFLQVLFSYGYFKWHTERSGQAFTLMVIAFAGAIAVKETFFIFFLTWWIATACVRVAEAVFPTEPAARESRRKSSTRGMVAKSAALTSRFETSDAFAIGVLGMLAVFALFSGFFMNPSGLVDMVRAFMFWTKTGTSSGHDKPFSYWLTLMWRYEWPGLLGIGLAPAIFFAVSRPARVMVLTAIGTWLAYSLIPYKTPWLILNVLWPLAFVLGFAMQGVPAFAKKFSLGAVRWVFPVLVIFAIGESTERMLKLNFRDYTQPTEPYVYVQSTLEFKHVMGWIGERLRLRPEDLNMKLAVLNRDTWPMPWTLGDFTNLAWGKPDTSDLQGAAVVLIDASARVIVEKRLTGKYWVEPFQIRDAYEGGFAYFDYERFKGIVPSGSPVFDSATFHSGGGL